MEQWRIDSSGVSRYDTEEHELFLYQHLRAQNGKIQLFHQKTSLLVLTRKIQQTERFGKTVFD